MAVKIRYFAWVREKTGKAEEIVDLPAGVTTVADLVAWLKGRGPEYAEASARGPLQASLIVHRIGKLEPGDNIVLVVTASAHREAAFAAAEFLMDYLKTSAPFWKKELAPDGGERWVEARQSDDRAAER